jgi:hypothetical protein
MRVVPGDPSCYTPPDTHTHTHDAMVGVPGASRLMMLMSPSTVPAARRWETLGFGLNWTERTGAVCRSMCASWACSPAPVGWREGWGREDGVRRGARAIGGLGRGVGHHRGGGRPSPLLTLEEGARVPHGDDAVGHAAHDEAVRRGGRAAGAAARHLAPGQGREARARLDAACV